MKSKQEIVDNWLPRYTGVPLESFGQHILLTNFGGYLNDNLRAVHAAFAFPPATWYRLARNSFEASFADAAQKAGWIARLDAYFAERGVAIV